MEVFTKAPSIFRIEDVNVTREEPKMEAHIFIELTEDGKSKTVRMSALQLNNMCHNVANLLKHTSVLKTKLQQN